MSFPSSKPTNFKDYYLQRSFEILPAFLTWFILVSLFIFSFFLPVWVAIFIIIFDLYWLIKAIIFSFYTIVAYRKTREWQKIDWLYKIKNQKSKIKNFKNWQGLYHLIIIPTYNEGLEILRPSFQSLVDSNYPKDKMIVVLAIEERVGQDALKRAKILENEFSDKFFIYITTVHPSNIRGEAKCKGANITWAAREAKIVLDKKKINYEDVIVSAFDCDTRVHPEYFACVSYQWMVNPDRMRLSFQPLPMYHNNIWDVPSFARFVAFSSTFWQMIQSISLDRIVTFSSHSMNFKTLVEVDYWPVNTISDDSIIFFKCFSHYNGNYRVQPIYLPVFMDAVIADTWFKTFFNQYKQLRRWAYGVENVPLILRSFLANKEIPLSKKIAHIHKEIGGRLMWATAPIIIAGLGWLPLILGSEEFRRTVIAFNLPRMVGTLMTIAMLGLIVSMFLSFFLLPPVPKRYKHRKLKRFFVVISSLLAPIIAIPLGALPMIDAQMRLALGKYMEFWVTEKTRK